MEDIEASYFSKLSGMSRDHGEVSHFVKYFTSQHKAKKFCKARNSLPPIFLIRLPEYKANLLGGPPFGGL